MSSTRYAKTPADSEASPERHLASGSLRGISIGLNIVTRVARVREDEERAAMIWLTNYAHLRDLTADALSDELDLDKTEIRRALTDPEADLARFVRQVKILRAAFERPLETRLPGAPNPFPKSSPLHHGYGPLADTRARRKIRNAVKFAHTDAQIMEIIGKTRMGKSVDAAHEYLRRLDSAVWLHCPSGGTDRDFLCALARALGVSAGTGAKNMELRPRIMSCFGPRRVSLLFVDEGHRLWPVDIKSPPTRIEFLRDLWEQLGVAVVIMATPQYSASLARAMDENPRWAPGQWDGRVQRAHLADTMEDEDLRAVARYHAPDLSAPLIQQLVEQARSSEGFCGAMVKAIERVRFMAAEQGKPIDLEMLKIAQAESARGTRIEQIAGDRKITKLRRAA